MITIRPVADLAYYRLADHQVDDLHTYLAEGDAIANSRWLGTAADRYGLTGPVSASQFERIAHGLDPLRQASRCSTVTAARSLPSP